MRYLELVDMLDVELTIEQHIACAFLEGRGLRFCVDFGYDNAVEKAIRLIRTEM